MDKVVTIGISGASGVIYGIVAVKALSELNYKTHVVYTQGAIKVAEKEMSIDLVKELSKYANYVYSEDKLDAPISSSSFIVNTEGMIVIPCSTRTLAEISHGIANNLLNRAALNYIRIGKRLVLVIRETPLGVIELRNALSLAKLGVIILPASPGFYHQPKSIEDMINFIVGKALDMLNIKHQLYRRWGGDEIEPN
ncbi:MAG: UbiX family flavin prenyltransferase [Sulfolobaceae archaeon]|nr:UbiX family flavin prenyltransferase [Sulfolobaceae archaeon]